MLEAINHFVTTVLDPIGIVLGIITAIPIFWTWWQVVFGEQRRIRRTYRELRENPGERPGIIIFDLLKGKDARLQVENYRQGVEGLKNVPEERIVTVSRDKHITPDDIPELQREIRNAARALMTQGVDKIHLFYGGPAMVAAMIGAEFSNMPAIIHQYDPPNGTYVNFGPLRLPM